MARHEGGWVGGGGRVIVGGADGGGGWEAGGELNHPLGLFGLVMRPLGLF